ncbi:MAG: biosynthetic arginine decarboxylase [Planctomycetota bacterium]
MQQSGHLRSWTTKDSLDLYNVELWSAKFYSINQEGNVVVRPRRDEGPAIDLRQLVEEMRARGYALPLLLRFVDILSERIGELADCFSRAIDEYGYDGAYRGVYPIKVNQQSQVVQQLLDYGRDHHLGLEVGSKPELLVALALLEDRDALLICNGYKDEAYVETALLAQKLGRRPILVIDRFLELEMMLRVARRHGIRPHLGIRAKLLAPGAGRWAESGGSRSKFGLSTSEIMQTIERLREAEMLDCLQLLHFHLGSQIPSIRTIKDALREASRILVELHKMGAPMRYFDVGGGLAVDYDGSNTNFHSSMNYSVQEYANDVVTAIAEACESRQVPEPDIVTEAGRALVAHHAVLVFDVLDTAEVAVHEDPGAPAEGDHAIVHALHETWSAIRRRNLLEPYHDAIEYREEASQLFDLGYLDLEGRAQAEKLFFACCTKLQRLLGELPRVPEELETLEQALADTYFCNFSVFQSLPDSWAVGQLFPIMPIHRLAERPTRRATLADLTCDSDGKVDAFVDLHDVRKVLSLHSPDGAPYYLGVFLVGAYQEILGDLHNLFGDTNAVHIILAGDRYRVEHFEGGDTVSEVLDYVAFDRRDLLQRVRKACEDGLWHQRVTPEETALLLKRYEEGLNSYTYLSDTVTAAPEPTVTPELPVLKRTRASAPTPRSGS